MLDGNPFLSGTISDDIGSLSDLVILSAAGTGLSGTLPQSISNLAKLIYLNLGGCRLNGTLPNISLPNLQFMCAVPKCVDGDARYVLS